MTSAVTILEPSEDANDVSLDLTTRASNRDTTDRSGCIDLPLFPSEVWDMVIDVSDNPLGCALTCRSWVERSQRNLFRSIQIRDERKLCKLLNALRLRPENGEFIISINMQEKSCYDITRLMGDKKGSGMVQSNMGFPYMTLVELSPYMKNLRKITLGGTEVRLRTEWGTIVSTPMRLPIATGVPQEPFFAALRHHRSSLEHLTLNFVEFRSLHAFFAIIHSFDRLHILNIKDITFKDLPRAPFFHNRAGPTLQYLQIVVSDPATTLLLFQELYQSGVASRLTMLDLSCVDCRPGPESEAELAGKLISACGASLRVLKPELCNVLKLARLKYIDLSSNIALESLRISQVIATSWNYQCPKRLHWIISILSSLPTQNNLRYLSIVLRMIDNPHNTADHSIMPRSKLENDLRTMDALFTGAQFSKLEFVHIRNFLVTVPRMMPVEATGIRSRDKALRSPWVLFPLSMGKGIMKYHASSKGNTSNDIYYTRLEADSEDDEY